MLRKQQKTLGGYFILLHHVYLLFRTVERSVGLTENAGHEYDGHEIDGRDIEGQDIYHLKKVTLQCCVQSF